MFKYLPIIYLVLIANFLSAQDNIIITNPTADQVLKGNFNPADFQMSTVIDHPQTIIENIQNQVNTDSITRYLEMLSSFETRNSGSDTLSSTRGFGAARRWVFSKFQQFSEQNENRLLPSYLQFDLEICGMMQHRNIFGILPGNDADNHNVIIVEAHMDSRCEGVCDVDCLAEGVEDNGSGTALVLELARLMSQFTFDHTIVFLVTTAEEQGLLGADAFAEYCRSSDIPIKGVFNNDIVGGIICGETSSAPSCPGLNHVDSTQVRLFSSGGLFSTNKQFVRWIKLQYEEELNPIVDVPMQITIMSAEDRSGRGGDHIPFRQRGYRAMRFTSANEHGNANSADPDYHDRQHSIRDILGTDTDNDGIIDSFFVDLNYLARNTVINGTSVVAAAQGVEIPSLTVTRINDSIINVVIEDPQNYGRYKVGKRFFDNDFDEVFEVEGTTTFQFIAPENLLFVSVAAVDENGIESCFSDEERPTTISSVDDPLPLVPEQIVELFQNRPNPFDEATFINYEIKQPISSRNGVLFIKDMTGKTIHRYDAPLHVGYHEFLYTHGYNSTGAFIYGLAVDGKVLAQKQMIFAY